MTAKWPWRLAVATYNILADAYVKPEYYPRCAPEDFVPKTRALRLDGYLSTRLDDVICLQEVEYAAFERIAVKLDRHGFVGRWAHKTHRKPDGCATFVQASRGEVAWSVIDLFGPRSESSGHIALAATIQACGLRVVNTHLKWDPPETPIRAQVGVAQAEHLISRLGSPLRTVVCGDFNATPDHGILERFRAAGYADPHPPPAATFNGAGNARKIDYVLHSPDLEAEPRLPQTITDETPMPSPSHPSDHLLLAATFRPKVA